MHMYVFMYNVRIMYACMHVSDYRLFWNASLLYFVTRIRYSLVSVRPYPME